MQERKLKDWQGRRQSVQLRKKLIDYQKKIQIEVLREEAERLSKEEAERLPMVEAARVATEEKGRLEREEVERGS